MKKEIFREYDIRGIYPDELNENNAYIIGKSYGSIIQEKYQKRVCVIGQDNRSSSEALTANLVKGLLESGVDVINLGLCTTPMFIYATLKTNTIFGIMVTASHNPKEYNGFKFTFDNLGFARGKQIYTFRDYTLAQKFLSGQGKETKLDIFPYYKSFIKENIKMGNKKLKVVIDPGNGTTSLFAKEIHQEFKNLDIIMINDISDPSFPNHHPDPNVYENLKMLQDKVVETQADIGIAYDGDGDRLGVVDNKGQIVTTEYLMILIIKDIIAKAENKTFLYDVKSSKVLEEQIIKLGGVPLEYRTGASYTRYGTNINKLIFGGEYSGHMYLNDRWWGFDSGIYNGLRIIEILSNQTKPLNELWESLPHYFITPEIKLKVHESKKNTLVNMIKDEYKSLGFKISEIDGVKAYYDNGWILVRASNTTPNITIRIEADTKENQTIINNHFMNILQKYLQVLK